MEVLASVEKYVLGRNLVREAFRYSRPVFYASVFNACMFVGLFWSLFPAWQLLSWFGAFFLIALWRLLLAVGFDKAAVDDWETVRQWKQRFSLGLRASVVAWVAGALLFYPEGSDRHLVYYLLCFTGVSAGGAFSLASFRTNVAWIVIGISATIAFQISYHTWEEGWVHTLMINVMVLSYIGFLMSSSAHYREAIVQRIRLQFENEGLIEKLTVEKDRAESANQAKSAFLATMSHEIRTPLNGVMGLMQVMEDEGLNSVQRDYLGTMKRSATSLLQILNEILDYSKVESGKLELESLRFDWVELVSDVGNLMRSNAERKGIGFDLHIDANEPRSVFGDPIRLRQIVTNLLSNSIKFTERGRVQLKASLLQVGEGEVRVRIEVIDTGIGMSEEGVKSLFSRFSQVDSSMSRRYGGTGLGLAISQRLAELMDTKIEVTSKEGVGSRFWLEPLFRVADEEAQGASQKTGSGAGDLLPASFSAKVLLVEDNLVSRKVGALILGKLGLTCEVAENGLEAIKRVQQEQWDLVFMDCQMPELDGLETTKRIRNLDTLPGSQPKIVACTANASADDRERCLEAGMDDFISKPIDLDELRAVLARVFQQGIAR